MQIIRTRLIALFYCIKIDHPHIDPFVEKDITLLGKRTRIKICIKGQPTTAATFRSVCARARAQKIKSLKKKSILKTYPISDGHYQRYYLLETQGENSSRIVLSCFAVLYYQKQQSRYVTVLIVYL